MITYDKFYHKYGIRRTTDFNNPIIDDLGIIGLPKGHIIHFCNEVGYPTINSPLYSFLKQPFIFNQLSYIDEQYKTKKVHVYENKVIKDLSTKYPNIPILKESTFNKIISKRSKDIIKKSLILTYNNYDKDKLYSTDVLNDYYAFTNKYNTIFKKISILNSKIKPKVHTLQHYLYIDLPVPIYSLEIFKKYVYHKVDTSLLKIFHNESNLNILHIFKLILGEDSIYDTLIESGYKNTTLVLNRQGKVILLDISTLLSFRKDIDYIPNNNKVTPEILFHMFYTLILKLDNSIEVNLSDDILKTSELEKPSSLAELSKFMTTDTENIDDDNVGILDDDIVTKDITPNDTEVTVIQKLDNVISKSNDTTETIEFKYKEITDVNTDDLETTIKSNLDHMLETKVIDKTKHTKLSKLIKTTLDKKSPFGDDLSIADLLKEDKKDIILEPDEMKMPSIPDTLIHKDYAMDPIRNIDKKYMEMKYKKDVVRTFMSMNKVGIIVKDIKVETSESILGSFYTYHIDVTDKGKSSYTVKINVPIVSDEGLYTISGNKYFLKKQRVELPILKLDYNKVGLNSATGKLNIMKAPLKKYDRGYVLYKKLIKLNEEKIISQLVFGTFDKMNKVLPQDYNLISRYVKSFTIRSYSLNFNYITRKDILPDLDISKIEKDGSIFIGKDRNKNPLVMTKYNEILLIKNNKPESLGNIYTLLNINSDELINEFSLIKIYKSYVPVVYILAYYLGFENLLKRLDVEYEIFDGNKRISNSSDQLVIKLEHKTVVLKITNETQRMILSAMSNDAKITRKITWEMLNNKNFYGGIFRELDLKLMTVSKIKILEDLYVDANTKTLLENMNEPTTFIGLLIRSSEMLTDDNYKNPTGIDNAVLKGYERIPQYIHRTLVDAIESKTNEEAFGRSRLTVDQYNVWKIINEDSAGELINDINPIAYSKQKEDTTFLGFQGRNKDTMVKATRAYNVQDLGVISEAVKDSTDVGITAFMSANPKLKSILGEVGSKDNLNWSNLVSTNTMLSPFILADDPKRVVYSGIQASHVTGIKNPKVFPIRTEYDTLMAYKMPKKFTAWAEEDGVVTKLTNSSMTVKYKTGTKDYTFKEWTSKEESGVTFKHILKPNVIKNQKVKKGDILYYDVSFFEPDMFDKTKVVYRTGTFCRVSLKEEAETFEDSFLVSPELSKDITMDSITVRDLTLDATDVLKNMVSVNSEVKSSTPLFIISSDLVEDDKISDDTMDLLQGFVKNTPKAKYDGHIVKLEVYYNCDLKDMSSSMKKLVMMSEEFMIDSDSGKHYPGKVNSSYSINGKPLDSGKVHIKYFIEHDSDLITGDKIIVANQLKATLTTISDIPMKDELGRPIDLEFAYAGVYNRIVPSADLMGSTATVMDAVTKRFIEIYRGK